MENIEWKPLAGKVLVKPDKFEEKTASGIYMPESKSEKPLSGEVIVVGKALDSVGEMEVKEGDKVLYGKYAGTEVEVDGEKMLLLMERDILLVKHCI